MSDDTDVLGLLHPGLQGLVKESGWPSLTDVQRKAIPPLMRGQDCVIEAPTAGGKTEAVLFPSLTRIADQREPPGVRILYLAPLRALLNDLEKRGVRYAQACGLHAFKWHGDVSQKEKVKQLQIPPHLLLTTPESTEAILLRKPQWAQFFATLSVIIIDEAHNFASGDRGHHLQSLLQRLEKGTGTHPQRIALTATIGNPEGMLEWLSGQDRQPGTRVEAGGRQSSRDYRIHFFNEEADHDGMPPEKLSRVRQLVTLAGLLENRRSIVFAPSRKKSEQFASAFARPGQLIRSNLKVRTHHSAVSRFFREEAEAAIRLADEQGIDAIISTSTLELGIDIGELDQVVQLDELVSSSALMQRVGRTGRRPGKAQFFRGLCVGADELLLLTATTQLALDGKCEALRFPHRAFHILAHQIICLALQQHGTTAERIWDTVSDTWCYSGVEPDELNRLIEHMVDQDYLRTDADLLLVGHETERLFLGAGWRRLFAVFESAPLYEVHSGKDQVGTLDASFVETLRLPFNFVLGGRLWTATSLDPKSRILRAKRAKSATAPAWASFGGHDVPYETAQEIGRLLKGASMPRFLDDEALAMLRDLRFMYSQLDWAPGRVRIDATTSEIKVITFAGDKINRTLAKLFQAEGLAGVTSNYRQVKVKSSAEDIERTHGTVSQVIDDVRGKRWSSPQDLEAKVSSVVPRFRFSPFAVCLPTPLYVAAIADEKLDRVGLEAVMDGLHP